MLKTKYLSLFSQSVSFKTYYLQNDADIFYRISESQSGFKPGDSCVNQLLAITNEMFPSFNGNSKVKLVFLDISKIFNKVWHKRIIHKLKHNGIAGNLLSLLTDFLRNRKQRVILNGKISSWANINASACQNVMLGPLFFS